MFLLSLFLFKKRVYSNRHGLAYKFYRNAVNKERKLCKGKYYASKVQDLKGLNPRSWWKEVNKLSGAKSQNVNLLNALNVPDFENLTKMSLLTTAPLKTGKARRKKIAIRACETELMTDSFAKETKIR